MKQLLSLLITATSFFGFSQQLPKVSQKSTVNQTIGLNEISINYSRPNVNGRTIFGDLVPYGEVWRLGANECTQFTCSEDLSIGDATLPAGTYGVFATPQKNQWKIHFNSESEQWGSYNYDPAKTVLSYTAARITASHTETMSISFENLMESSATLVIRWSDVMICVPFTTDTKKAVEKEIKAAIAKGENLAKVHYNAASYYEDINDVDAMNMHLNKSLELERGYYNVFMKAQLMAKEDRRAARQLADEAIALAEKANKQDWVGHMTRLSKDWQ